MSLELLRRLNTFLKNLGLDFVYTFNKDMIKIVIYNKKK